VGGLELPAWAGELLCTARVARLGLLDDRRRPRVLPVTFALAQGSVWSAIDDKPKRVPGDELARVRWLRESPQAALLVDYYAEDWSELAWVQLLGRVTVLDGAPPPAALIDKYPAYRARAPSGPLLRLEIERALCWRARDG
jgi:PPOX class probable F420-dependent enzyme